uniref:Uncharacterized protein n=2 Tax=Lotharella globosa TaxID=91324 RepID=A0A7S3Z2F7_9EUKA
MQKNKAVSSSPSSISKNHTSYDGEEHGESSSPLFPEECRNLLAKDDSGDDDDDNDDDDDDDDNDELDEDGGDDNVDALSDSHPHAVATTTALADYEDKVDGIRV